MKKLFLLLLSVLISTQTFAASSALNFSALGVGGGGGFSNVDSFTSDGTWSPPSGIDAVCVRGVAAGGGGGGGTSSTNGSGAGGNGGHWSTECIPVSSSNTYTIDIGAGGTAGTDNTNGGDGADTCVLLSGVKIVCWRGGLGGGAGTPGGAGPVRTPAFGNGGLGGAGNTGNTTGNSGQLGTGGLLSSGVAGAGGDAEGYPRGAGGGGGASFCGAGGKGQGSGGTNATSPTANCGAGGGGGFGSVGGGTVSSAGASGRMDIFY